MRCVTRAPDRIPPISGVSFKGIEGIDIESRSNVIEKIHSFIEGTNKQSKPMIIVIRGEWGEGKSKFYDAVGELLKEKRFCITKIHTRTLINAYETLFGGNSPLVRIVQNVSRLLLALAYSIVEDSSERDLREGFELEHPSLELRSDHKSAEETIRAFFTSIREKGCRKLFIFIDEFEELLLHQEEKKGIVYNILSGLKELADGDHPLLSDDSDLAGFIHLILAVTPDAYNLMLTSREFTLIAGGLARRFLVVDLPPITRREGVKFLWDLMEKYSYNSKLPDPLPVSSLGVFATLHRIASGNLGTMVSLFAKSMSAARSMRERDSGRNDEIYCIDGCVLVEALRGEEVTIYGASTTCFNWEALDRLTDSLKRRQGASSVELLKLLVGELKPFSKEELAKRLRSGVKIESLIDAINQVALEEYGVTKAVTKCITLNRNEIYHFVDMLRESGLVSEDGVKNYLSTTGESIEEILDKLSFFDDESSLTEEKFFLPLDKNVFLETFGLVERQEGEVLFSKVLNRYKGKIRGGTLRYMTTSRFHDLIYPLPAPFELSFIKDSRRRLDLWREIAKELTKMAPEQGIFSLKTLFDLIGKSREYSNTLDLRNKEIKPKRSRLISKELSGTLVYRSTYMINTSLFFIWGNLNEKVADELKKFLKEDKNKKDLIMIIYTGKEDKGFNLKLKYPAQRIVPIRVDIETLKLMMAIHTALHSELQGKDLEKFIDEGRAQRVAADILQRRLGLLKILERYVNDLKDSGHVARPPSLIEAKGEIELVNTLRFFLNIIEKLEEIDSLSDIYKFNIELQEKYFTYGRKGTGLIPDIEEPQFTKLTTELIQNGLLKKDRDGHYTIQILPQEVVIINYLKEKDGKGIFTSELSHLFIGENVKDFRRLIEKYYTELLKERGFIRKRKRKREEEPLISLIDYDLHKTSLSNKYNELSKDIEHKKYVKELGVIYQTKKRGERLIVITDLIDEITAQWNTLEILEKSSGSELKKRAKMKLIDLLLTLTEEYLKNFIFPAIEIYKEYEREIESLRSKIWEVYMLIGEKVRKMNTEYGISILKWDELKQDLREIKRIEEISSCIENDLLKIDVKSETFLKEFKLILESHDLKTKFSYDAENGGGLYFNPKLAIASSKIKEASEIVQEIEKQYERLEEEFKKLEEDFEKIENFINSDLESDMTLSIKMHRLLKNYVTNPIKGLLSDEDFSDTDRLTDVINNIITLMGMTRNNILEMGGLVENFYDLYKKEKEFMKILRETEKQVRDLEEIKTACSELYDILLSTQEGASSLNKRLDEIREEYKNLVSDLDKLSKRLIPYQIKASLRLSIDRITNITDTANKLKKDTKKAKSHLIDFLKSRANGIRSLIKVLSDLYGLSNKASEKNQMFELVQQIDEMAKIINSGKYLSAIGKFCNVIRKTDPEEIAKVLSSFVGEEIRSTEVAILMEVYAKKSKINIKDLADTIGIDLDDDTQAQTFYDTLRDLNSKGLIRVDIEPSL